MSARTYSYLTVLIAVVIGLFFINSFLSSNPRTLFQDVVQGFFVGFGLAYITLQILGRVKATKVNGWTTMFSCGEPGIGFLSRAACALKFAWPDKRAAGGDVLDYGCGRRRSRAVGGARLHHALPGGAASTERCVLVADYGL